MMVSESPRTVQMRELMVTEQIAARGIRDARVLDAMRSVPRHFFVPEAAQHQAYDDHPLAIGLGQTISQPFIVALMTELLELNGSEKVLEVGTGSGYQTAILAELAREVYSIELVPELAESAAQRLGLLHHRNIFLRFGDGAPGWPEAAPFDAIIVTAAPARVPEPLLEQLIDGGRLVVPVGAENATQMLTLIRRQGERLVTRQLEPVRFVPLRGGFRI